KDRRGAFLSSLSVIEDITERKKAEEALRRSEGTLRSIYQAAPIGIGMVSHPEGALSWTNERVSAMTGYSPQELRGMPTHRLYPSQEEHEKAEKILGERVREKGFGSLETRWQRKDGSVIDLLLSSAAIEPSDLSLGMVFTALDISQRKQAEEARRLSEEKFEKAFKASPIWVSITTVEEGRFLEVNDTFSSITGYNRQEALGRTSFELRFWLDPERDRQRVMEEFRRQGYFRNLEVKMRYKDGKVHDMLWSADAIDYEEQPCLINVLTDITEIKRAERALAESEERMRAILEASPNPVVVYDTKGRTTFLNPAFTKVFGWEAVELLGKQVPFIPESEQESTQLRIEEMMTSGKSTTLESKRLTKQGDLLDVFISASCIRNTQEEIIGSVVILTDITQRKNLEAQLRQAQKMEAIGTLAGGIAHDFNNILSAVVGYAELALEDAQEGLPTPEDLKQIISAAQRAKDLTRQILTFSRKAETELRPLNLNQEVEHAAKLLKRTIPRMIEIDLSLTEDLATIRADVNQIEQILMNLGTNAKDAMPDGGRLKIQTENINITGNKRCSACGTAFYGDFVRLRVSDTGYGMEQQILEHIFEPFFTTKKVGEGTGLGLSTVFGIMKSHHGHIICNSAPGKGTTFDLYLPASTGEGSRRDEEKEFSGEVPGGRETLLVVDDEKPIRDLAEKILTRRGYQVLRANSGERALDIYRQQIRDIDLVVLDISMPGMGGYKCLQALLAINPQAKVIIATGYSRNGPLKQILASGAAGYVAKPFRKVELLRKVREVLDHEPKKVQRL
ncbi:MAG: PAS domain S-box protein, partial [Desulfarculaceae bacterium]